NDLRVGVDCESGQVFVSKSPDRIIALQRKAEPVDAAVADRAGGILRVPHDLLSNRKAVRPLFLRQLRHIWRWTRQPLAQQGLYHPVPSKNRTGSRSAGFL